MKKGVGGGGVSLAGCFEGAKNGERRGLLLRQGLRVLWLCRRVQWLLFVQHL